MFDLSDDLVDLLVETTNEEYPIQDGDVVVITSKVVSTAGECMVLADDGAFTDRDERVADVTGPEYEDSEGVPNSDGLIRLSLRKTIQLLAHLKAREWF